MSDQFFRFSTGFSAFGYFVSQRGRLSEILFAQVVKVGVDHWLFSQVPVFPNQKEQFTGQ